jgi:hypothetical protein
MRSGDERTHKPQCINTFYDLQTTNCKMIMIF